MGVKVFVGNLSSSRDRLRSSGRFASHPKCDGCGRPCTEHFTDDRVCGGGDGPGFFLCGRKSCVAKREAVEAQGGIGALRLYYTNQRTKNEV
jgi:hypothetical protein